MHVGAPRLELSETEARLVSSLTDESGDSFDLFLAVDRSLVGLVDAEATPFLPIVTVAASYLGEDVTVETPVSPAVAIGAERATRGLVGRWGERPVTVHGPRREPGFVPGSGRGLFLSRGVDSMYSLVRSVQGEIPGFTHLLGVADLDHWVSPAAREGSFHRTRLVARDVGLPLIRLTTNARALLDPIADWLRAHGSVFSSCALLVGPLLRSATLAASFSLPYAESWRSHPDIEMWSSETTTIQHDGDDTSRPDKVVRLTQEPDLLRKIKVCWVADTAGNCGRCPKCLLTMTILDVLGVLEPGSFDAEFTLDALADAPFAMSSEMLREHLDWLAARPGVPDELRRAWVAHGRQHGELADEVGDMTNEEAADGEREDLEALVGHLADSGNRSVAWCLVDEQSAGSVRLADVLNATWGPGIVYLHGVPWTPDQQSGLPSHAVSRLLRASCVRYWWSDEDDLDLDRMGESVEHGCLPIQAMDAGPAVLLQRRLPRPLRVCVVAVTPHDPPGPPDPEQTTRGLTQVAAHLAAASPRRTRLRERIAARVREDVER